VLVVKWEILCWWIFDDEHFILFFILKIFMIGEYFI